MRTVEGKKKQNAAKCARRRAFLILAKSKPCVDCSHQFPWWVMQFDHVRGEKKFEVSRGTKTIISLSCEIAKCELVCANCHADRTYRRRNNMAKQEYSFPSNRPDQPGGGVTPQVSDEKAPDNLQRPTIPQLEPAIRGIAENAGFDAITLEGEALLAKTIGGAPNYAALRDGDNSEKATLGDNPNYPSDLMGDAFKGQDMRPGR